MLRPNAEEFVPASKRDGESSPTMCAVQAKLSENARSTQNLNPHAEPFVPHAQLRLAAIRQAACAGFHPSGIPISMSIPNIPTTHSGRLGSLVSSPGPPPPLADFTGCKTAGTVATTGLMTPASLSTTTHILNSTFTDRFLGANPLLPPHHSGGVWFGGLYDATVYAPRGGSLGGPGVTIGSVSASKPISAPHRPQERVVLGGTPDESVQRRVSKDEFFPLPPNQAVQFSRSLGTLHMLEKRAPAKEPTPKPPTAPEPALSDVPPVQAKPDDGGEVEKEKRQQHNKLREERPVRQWPGKAGARGPDVDGDWRRPSAVTTEAGSKGRRRGHDRGGQWQKSGRGERPQGQQQHKPQPKSIGGGDYYMEEIQEEEGVHYEDFLSDGQTDRRQTRDQQQSLSRRGASSRRKSGGRRMRSDHNPGERKTGSPQSRGGEGARKERQNSGDSASLTAVGRSRQRRKQGHREDQHRTKEGVVNGVTKRDQSNDPPLRKEVNHELQTANFEPETSEKLIFRQNHHSADAWRSFRQKSHQKQSPQVERPNVDEPRDTTSPRGPNFDADAPIAAGVTFPTRGTQLPRPYSASSQTGSGFFRSSQEPSKLSSSSQGGGEPAPPMRPSQPRATQRTDELPLADPNRRMFSPNSLGRLGNHLLYYSGAMQANLLNAPPSTVPAAAPLAGVPFAGTAELAGPAGAATVLNGNGPMLPANERPYVHSSPPLMRNVALAWPAPQVPQGNAPAFGRTGFALGAASSLPPTPATLRLQPLTTTISTPVPIQEKSPNEPVVAPVDKNTRLASDNLRCSEQPGWTEPQAEDSEVLTISSDTSRAEALKSSNEMTGKRAEIPKVRSDFPKVRSDFPKVRSDFPKVRSEFPKVRSESKALGPMRQEPQAVAKMIREQHCQQQQQMHGVPTKAAETKVAKKVEPKESTASKGIERNLVEEVEPKKEVKPHLMEEEVEPHEVLEFQQPKQASGRPGRVESPHLEESGPNETEGTESVSVGAKSPQISPSLHAFEQKSHAEKPLETRTSPAQSSDTSPSERNASPPSEPVVTTAPLMGLPSFAPKTAWPQSRKKVLTNLDKDLDAVGALAPAGHFVDRTTPGAGQSSLGLLDRQSEKASSAASSEIDAAAGGGATGVPCDGDWDAPSRSKAGKIWWSVESLWKVRFYSVCKIKPDIPPMNHLLGGTMQSSFGDHGGRSNMFAGASSMGFRPSSGGGYGSAPGNYGTRQCNKLGGAFNDDLWEKTPNDISFAGSIRRSHLSEGFVKRIDNRHKADIGLVPGGGRAPSAALSGDIAGLWRSPQKPEVLLPDSAWTLHQKKEKEAGDELKMSVRRLRGQLNKMTAETFETIYEKLVTAVTQTDEVRELINLIFEKATTQHTYVKMYADLTVRLDQEFKQRGLFDQASNDSGSVEDFRHWILQACQESFNSHLLTDYEPPKDADEEEQFESLLKYKLAMKGNLKFVGELLMRGMMTAKVGFTILSSLIEHGGDHQLEALATFMATVDQFYERSPVLKERIHQQYHTYLERIAAIAQDPKVPNRVQCLLKDVLEGRTAAQNPPPPPAVPLVSSSANFHTNEISATNEANGGLTRSTSGRHLARRRSSDASAGQLRQRRE